MDFKSVGFNAIVTVAIAKMTSDDLQLDLRFQFISGVATFFPRWEKSFDRLELGGCHFTLDGSFKMKTIVVTKSDAWVHVLDKTESSYLERFGLIELEPDFMLVHVVHQGRV